VSRNASMRAKAKSGAVSPGMRHPLFPYRERVKPR
jgi:hypothetical protein